MRVALTFDAEHPGRPANQGGEDRILAALAAAGAPATFFLQGRWARANPAQARRIAEAGHLIGNHSNYHAPMDALADDWLRADVRKAEETITKVTGVDPKPWFRCPFGSGMENPRVLETLAELGYRHVGWDVDPEDWHEDRTAAELESLAIEGDAIVLLHAWPEATAAALPGLLEGLADAELVTVAELL